MCPFPLCLRHLSCAEDAHCALTVSLQGTDEKNCRSIKSCGASARFISELLCCWRRCAGDWTIAAVRSLPLMRTIYFLVKMSRGLEPS